MPIIALKEMLAVILTALPVIIIIKVLIGVLVGVPVVILAKSNYLNYSLSFIMLF